MLRWMFAFAKSYVFVYGKVVDVLSLNGYVYLKKFPPYPDVGWPGSPNCLATEII